ncbi:MAG: hypothetical protein P8183_24450, partial [Anaerolineae bacterium]
GIRSGVASAGSSTIRRVGSAMGIAIVGTILATTLTNTATTKLENSQLLSSNPAYTAIRDQIVQKLDTTSTFGQDTLQELIPQGGLPSSKPATTATKPPTTGQSTNNSQSAAPPVDMAALGKEVKMIFKEANATAVKNVGWAATFFVALGTLSALMLPNPDVEENHNGARPARPQRADEPSALPIPKEEQTNV